MNREKLASIAAICVPLAFIGGWSTGGFGMAIGSTVLWILIYIAVKPKS